MRADQSGSSRSAPRRSSSVASPPSRTTKSARRKNGSNNFIMAHRRAGAEGIPRSPFDIVTPLLLGDGDLAARLLPAQSADAVAEDIAVEQPVAEEDDRRA